MLDLEPVMIVLFCGVGFAGFAVSSALGIGGTMALLPVLLLRLDAAEAVALVSPVMLFHNVCKMVLFRRDIRWKSAAVVSLTAAPAAGVAALYTTMVEPEVLQLGIAAMIGIALVLPVLGLAFTLTDRGLFASGVVIGATSGLVGAAGPPTAVAMRARGLHTGAFVATIAVLAVAMQLAKIPAYLSTGALRFDRWPLALLLSGCALLGLFVGRAALTRLNPHRFRRAVNVLLGLIAVWLVVRVVLAEA